MTERFMKVETAPGEWVAVAAHPRDVYTVTTCDGVESSAVVLSLNDFRRLLALFPELREAPKP